MFRTWRKYFFLMLVILCTLVLDKEAYAISDDFKFVIDTIGVPQYNVYSDEINEDVYYTYNVLSYGSPEQASVNASQGFKAVEGGLWSSTGGKYRGIGQAGEYYYLGRSYSGSLISNVRYPVSFFPETEPNNWNYVLANGALQSWQDSSKYKYIEQLEYMKYTHILYDKLDFVNKKTNPYDLVEYNISASDIGFDKITLDACATWKTQGVMTAVRRESNGAIRYAIFSAAPMCAEATVKSDLICEDSYKISESETGKNVVISFGAHIENLNYYAKIEHVKQIEARLYINGVLVSSVSGSKKEKVSKNYVLNIDRSKVDSYPLYIEVKSSLYTEFAVDGLLRDGLSKNVNIVVEKYKNKIKSADIKLLSTKERKISCIRFNKN